MIDLHQLRLENALALLKHEGQAGLPTVSHGDQAYVQALIDQLCELSQKDPLTGLANRRHFHNVLAREIEVVTRSGEPALLLMLDVDHFKRVNDTYGHPAGDIALQTVAQALSHCVRPMDTLARFGGEEFVVILPSCQGQYGVQVAERIREAVAALNIILPCGNLLKVSISIGGAYAPRWVRSTPELWLDRADIELYRAKSEGRNRVCIEPQPMLSVSAEEKNLLFGAPSDAPSWMEIVTPDAGSAGGAMARAN